MQVFEGSLFAAQNIASCAAVFRSLFIPVEIIDRETAVVALASTSRASRRTSRAYNLKIRRSQQYTYRLPQKSAKEKYPATNYQTPTSNLQPLPDDSRDTQGYSTVSRHRTEEPVDAAFPCRETSARSVPGTALNLQDQPPRHRPCKSRNAG